MTSAELMQEALLEAKIALQSNEMPVGCVISLNGEIIARAHNERETLRDPTAHAEILAIRRACSFLHSWRLDECDIYVTLEPCPMCAGAISQARLHSLTYGAYDNSYGCAGSVYRICEDPVFNHFCRSTGGLMQTESENLIGTFFKNRRK